MVWLRIAAMAAACLTASAAAAEWQATVNAYGGVRFAAATDPGGTLTIRCAAPDPEAPAQAQAGTPFGAVIEISGELFNPGAGGDRMTATLFPDTPGYRFPVSVYDAQRDVWPLPIAMNDPSMLAALTAETLILDNGRGQAWSYSTDGLNAALSATFRACVAGWQSRGHMVPAGLTAFATSSTGQAKALPQTGVLPSPIAARITQVCNGPYQLDPSELLTGLIDSDTAPDYVLNWNTVRCTAGLARPLCGAANCSIDTYLSSRFYRHSERDSLLGIAPTLVPLSNGRMGIKISGTASVCSTGFCDRPFWWDGTRLRQ